MGWLSPKTEEQISASARTTPGLPGPAFVHSCLGEGLRKAALASRAPTSYEEDLRWHNTLLFVRSHRECANWWTSRHSESPVCMYALCARKHAHPAQGQAEAEVRAYRKENLFLWFSGEKDHVNLSDSPL